MKNRHMFTMTGRFLRRYGKWLLAAALVLLFCVLASGLAGDGVAKLDSAGYRAVSLLRCAPVTAFFKLYTNLAHPAALLAVSLLLVLFTRKKAYRVAVYVNLGLNTCLNLALKTVFLRGRPADVAHLVDETGYSFPSGHAMAAVGFYGFLIFLLWQTGDSRRQKRTLTALLSAGILLICVSRVYLGVHYASDVLAGACASLAYLITFTSVSKRYLARGETETLERNTGKKNEGLLASFLHAFDGLRAGMRTERNLMIHVSAMLLVILFGFLLCISTTEWLVCIVLFGLVISAELINTAIESVVDLCTEEIRPLARLAKDAAAGAVLVAAIASAAAGAVIFLPKILTLLLAAIG